MCIRDRPCAAPRPPGSSALHRLRHEAPVSQPPPWTHTDRAAFSARCGRARRSPSSVSSRAARNRRNEAACRRGWVGSGAVRHPRERHKTRFLALRLDLLGPQNSGSCDKYSKARQCTTRRISYRPTWINDPKAPVFGERSSFCEKGGTSEPVDSRALGGGREGGLPPPAHVLSA